jgi:hypothetical protein
VTIPEKPDTPDAVTVTACALPPAVRPAVVGLAVIEKSGVGAVAPAPTVSASEVVCVNEPDVPVKTTVAFAAAAPAAAVKLTCWGVPIAKVRVAGEAVTPAGAPANDTVTIPEKPDTPDAVTVTACALPPAVRPAVIGLAVIEKSAVAAGFCVTELQPTVQTAISAINIEYFSGCQSLRMGVFYPYVRKELDAYFEPGLSNCLQPAGTLVKGH